jgi:excisionase family DNA binding protein
VREPGEDDGQAAKLKSLATYPATGYDCGAMGKMLSVAEVAKQLGVDRSRVRVLCRQRRIPGAKLVGRIWLLPDHFKITPGVPGRRPKG